MIIESNSDETLPFISFAENEGIIELKGRMINAMVKEHLTPVFNYIKQYLDNSPMDITVNVRIEYFSTASYVVLLELFNLLKDGVGKKHPVIINWFYETDDEELLEEGNFYKEITGLIFNFIPLE